MIRVVCSCGRVFQAEGRHGGKRTRCPACGSNLIIGTAMSTGSSEGEAEEVPSWWYPSLPPEALGADFDHPGEGDPEAIATTVLEHGPVPEACDRAGRPDRPRGAAAPDNPGRSLWTVAGAVAASAALILGVSLWIWSTAPTSGKATAVRDARTTGPSRDGGRGQRPSGAGDRRASPPDDLAALFGGHDRRADNGRPARRLRLLVPAYFYPAGDGRLQWRRLFDAAAKVDLVVVVNPSSGPGAERNAEYAALLAEAADRGVKLVGYINTEYAARPVSEVKSDVDKWLRFYPRIAGFFFDQQPIDARSAAYIAEIGAYTRGRIKDALVISNPGVPCDDSYLARRASDVVCVFSHFEGFAAFELPANLREYDPSHYAALVYQVAEADVMQSLLKEAIIKRIGWVYVTDSRPPNPWNRLPAYWEAEIEALSRLQ